jgi:hypothetical protein
MPIKKKTAKRKPAAKRKAAPSTTTRRGEYDRHKEAMTARSAVHSAKGREIGPLPGVADPKRRKKAAGSLLCFLESYFPDTFALAWSDDHRTVIGEAERVIVDGGLMALAMPRGNGKTSIAVRAALWALLTGRRRFVVLIAAEQGLADAMVSVLKAEMQFNDRLAEDWPEVCHPIRRLENITKRQQGQTLNGKPTLVKLGASEIVLPTVAGSRASGGIVRAVGLTGAVRGQVATTGDGRTVRPDLVLVDDPQTRESAKSPIQVGYRLALINADVLGLAGPGQALACLSLVTVVYPRDLSDRLLDREANPSWQGRRYRLLDAPPSDLQAWDEYAEHRRHSLREFGDNRLGNQFYEQNRERLDAGASAAWPARFNPDELSAVQSAMNIRIDRPDAFASEYQNDPEPEALGMDLKELCAEPLAKRVGGHDRYAVPAGCTRLTAFFDLGGKVHWWAVVAWNEHFGGAVVDYGCWPRQSRSVFAAADVRPSLESLFPGHTEAQRVYAGLEGMVPAVLGREYRMAGSSTTTMAGAIAGLAGNPKAGGGLRIERCLIDAGKWPDAVYQYVRSSPFAGVIYPSKGVGRSTTSAGVGRWSVRAGERVGHHWRLTLGTGSGRGRQIQFDPDVWKTFAWSALTVPLGGPHGLTLFGGLSGDGRPTVNHELLSMHLAAEYGTPTELRGETFDKWRVRPGGGDNHLFDCVVGAAVAASVCGLVARPDGAKGEPPAPKKAGRKLSDIQREKMAKG